MGREEKCSSLRFAIVTTFYPPYHFGGDALAAQRLVHALARRGHRAEVIHDADAFFALNPDADPQPLEEPDGVRVHTLRSKAGRWSCLATHQLGRPLVHGRRIQEILRSGFDVIHYHNISLVGGPGILAYGDAIKLYTAHEHWLVCPTHVLWRHNRELCVGRECVRCALRHNRPPQLWRTGTFMERQMRHVDAFLSPSRFSATKHEEFGFVPPMQVLPPFIAEAERDDTSSQPKEIEPDARPYLLCVGRLERIKGIQDVIPLFTGDGATDLLIAGSGSYEPKLRALAGDSRRVRFLGQVSAARLGALYRHATATILPSICYEVFPMVALESLCQGTPLIARRLGPFPEIIADSGGGLLFDTADELRFAIDRLVFDKALRATLSRAAVLAYEARWSEEAAMDRYLALVLSLATKRGKVDVLSRLKQSFNSPRLPTATDSVA